MTTVRSRKTLNPTIVAVTLALVMYPSCRRAGDLRKLDIELTAHFRTMMRAGYEARVDSLAPRFEERLLRVLATPESYHCAFDSLGSVMKIVRSADKRVRVFSWDEKAGGTWHDMAAFAHYRTDKGPMAVCRLDTGDEPLTGAFTDAIVYAIHQVSIDETTLYLTLGWGTHGAGHHHGIARLFRVAGERLIECDSCFQAGTHLVVQAPRSHRIDLAFDTATAIIAHNEFVLDGRSGFYRPTGRVVKLSLENGLFKGRSPALSPYTTRQ
jgi:hypothetical protein